MTSQERPQWFTALERKGVPLFYHSLDLEATEKPEYFQHLFGFKFSSKNRKLIDGKVILDLNEVEKLQEKIETKRQEESNYFDRVAERHMDQCEKIIGISEEIAKEENLREKSRGELLDLFERYVEEVLRMMPSLMTMPTIEKILQEEITAGLEKKIEDEESVEDYLNVLIKPEKENLVVKELREMMRLCAKIQSSPQLEELFGKSNEKILQRLPQVNEKFYYKLKEHADRFGFLDMYTYLGEPLKVEDVIERLKDFLARRDCDQRLKEIGKREEREEERYKKTINELDISGELLKKIEQARRYLYLRLYRLNIVNKGGTLVREFMEEIARRMGLEYKDIIYLTHQEIVDFLEGNSVPKRKKIARRQEEYGTVKVGGDLKLLSGKEEVKSAAEEEKIEKVRKMNGTIASRGNFRGKAKVVLSESEIGKVSKGDVLVTTMTNPNYVPAMIKVGAVVTDEGGILSHAGIVSRELGIPCVTGTEVASKMLSDGEMIEVDGEEGVVKIIDN